MKRFRLQPILMFAALLMLLGSSAYASSDAQELEREANAALSKFYKKVQGGQKFLSEAKGYLVFPAITKAGFIVGGSYGEGVLRVGGQTKYYYSTTSGSVGFQAGAQKYSMVIAFLTDASLKNFIKSDGWEGGITGSIALIDKGVGKDISSISYEKPIVVFVYGAKGLMGDVSLKGNKFQRIIP